MNENVIIYLANRVYCQPDWSWQSSTNGWNGYHIWCVESGGGHVSVCGEEYELFPGDLFLFDLKYEHFCTHAPERPLVVSTVYFSCPELNLETRVIRQKELLVKTVQQILILMEQEQYEQACLWLAALMSEFTEKQMEKREKTEAVRLACAYMEEHFPGDVSLEDLVKVTGYSKNQLIRLFQKERECTPMEYYVRKKIVDAKSQLMYSNRSIREIADGLGFCDVSYFSKVFRRQVGCSPGRFRGEIKKYI